MRLWFWLSAGCVMVAAVTHTLIYVYCIVWLLRWRRLSWSERGVVIALFALAIAVTGVGSLLLHSMRPTMDVGPWLAGFAAFMLVFDVLVWLRLWRLGTKGAPERAAPHPEV